MGEARITWGLLFISISIWCMMISLTKPLVLFNKPAFGRHKSRNFNSFFFLFFLSCIFAFTGYDTYHTWNDFIRYTNSDNMTHYEPVYRWLANFVGMRYFLWRAIVWGIAVVSIFYLATLLKDRTLGMMFSVVILLPMSYFVETRGASAHAMTLLGMSLLLGGDKLFKRNVILGLLLITSSFFFHRSNFLFIGLLVLSLFLPLKKKSVVVLSLIAFPFLLAAVTNALNVFVSGGFEMAFGDNMNIQNSALNYASGEKVKLNALGIMGLIIRRLPLILITAFMVLRISIQGLVLQSIYNFFYRATYVCIYISLLFAFQETSSWLFERVMFMSLFPMCFVFSKVMQSENKKSLFFKCIYISALLSISYSTLYKFYIS